MSDTPVQRMDRVREFDDPRRLEVIAMIEACGIPRTSIPLHTWFHRSGGTVFLEKYVLAEDGSKLWDEFTKSPIVEDLEIRPPAHLIPDWIPEN